MSYASTLNQLVNSTAPDKGFGLSLSIPLRNRAAQANQIRADLEYRQAEVRLHQLENQVRIEVRNAQFDVKQNRVAVQAAQSAVDLARQTLNADQQKLKVGLTTAVTILQDAATLTTGESNLVSAKAAYAKSRIELDRATGLLLEHANIDVADATRGQVTHLPNVPYAAPRQDSTPLAPTGVCAVSTSAWWNYVAACGKWERALDRAAAWPRTNCWLCLLDCPRDGEIFKVCILQILYLASASVVRAAARRYRHSA